MPIFEFSCGKHVTEILMDKGAQCTKCTTCGKLAERIVSKFAFTNSGDFNRRWHPEELNAEKDVKHWEKTHGKRVY